MERFNIEQIRRPTFRVSRRGYDTREVEKFLWALADWLEAGGAAESGSEAVKKKLERAGETTARLLSTAEEEAEDMRREAEERAAEILEQSESSARATTEAARAKATRTVDEGERRRNETEAIIRDLTAQRDAVISELDSLVRELRDAADSHRPEPGADPYATPAELDPLARGDAGPVRGRDNGYDETMDELDEEQVEA